MLTRLAGTHDLVPKSFLGSSDWLMHSELGYFAHSLVLGLNDGAVTLTFLADMFWNITIILNSPSHGDLWFCLNDQCSVYFINLSCCLIVNVIIVIMIVTFSLFTIYCTEQVIAINSTKRQSRHMNLKLRIY